MWGHNKTTTTSSTACCCFCLTNVTFEMVDILERLSQTSFKMLKGDLFIFSTRLLHFIISKIQIKIVISIISCFYELCSIKENTLDFFISYFTYSFTYFLCLFTLKVHFLQMARHFAISAPNETTNYRMMAYVYRRFSNLSFRCHQTPFDNLKLNINCYCCDRKN